MGSNFVVFKIFYTSDILLWSSLNYIELGNESGNGTQAAHQNKQHQKAFRKALNAQIWLNIVRSQHEEALHCRRSIKRLSKACYLYPFVQTGTEYIRVPKPNEVHIVTMAYVYALQGYLLSLIALNSAMKVETVLRQPSNPNCMPVATISHVLVSTCTNRISPTR